MLRLVSDENFNGEILRGLFRRAPELDIVRVQDVGLSQTPDPAILAWAGLENRIFVTHDRQTVPGFAKSRVQLGEPMPGVFLVKKEMAIGEAIEQLLTAIECLSPDECKDCVTHFPL